jgi:hypothetical protein
MISKEEVQVLQEVIAKQCVLAVPYAVAEAALYVVENYHLKRLEDSMAMWTAGSTCGHANADLPRPYRHCRAPESRRPDRSAQPLSVD